MKSSKGHAHSCAIRASRHATRPSKAGDAEPIKQPRDENFKAMDVLKPTDLENAMENALAAGVSVSAYLAGQVNNRIPGKRELHLN